jgi:peptide/nickel transport system substrate-binding protein
MQGRIPFTIRRWPARIATTLAASAILLGSVALWATEAAAADTPKRGGTLRVALNRPHLGFDHLAVPRGGMARQQALFAVHERLFDMDPKTGKLIPQLGVSADHNKDFTVWHVKLREGAKFSNGKEVTAEAYEWHFHRLFSSPLAATFKGEFGVAIREVVAASKYVIEFRFDDPAPQFESIMADNLYLWALNEPGFAKANQAKEGYNLMSVGAGPYMVEEYIPRKRMTLVRNPYYYAPERQFLDKIVFIPHPGPEPVRIRAILAGDYDAMATRGSGYVFAEKQKDIDIIYGSRTSTAPSLNFNTSRPPFNDVRVRRALLLSMDMTAMAKILSNGWKGARMGNSMFVHTNRWYCKDVQYPAQNLDEARRLLKEYGKPVTGTIWSGGLPTFLKYAETVQQFASKAGIDLKVKNIGRDVAAIVGPINQGVADMWVYSYGNVVDPVQVQTSFRSDNKANSWRVKSARIDAAIDKLVGAKDFEEKYDANCNLQRAFHAELPFIYGLEARNGIIKKPYVKGLSAPHNTLYMWQRAWLDK